MKKLLTGIATFVFLCLPVLCAAKQQDVVGQAVTITLANGSKVSGTVTKREGGKVSLKADLIGEIVIDEKDIAGFGPAATATPSQAAPAAATAPKVTWTTTGTAGYTFVSGAAPVLGIGDTHGVSLSMFTERAAPKDALSLSGAFTYQRTKPAPAAAKNGSLTFAYNRPINKTLTFISRTTYAKDSVQSIDRRFTNLDGLGIILVQNKRVSLSVVPGLGFTSTKYTVTPQLAPLFANVKNEAFGYGVFDYLKINLMPTLSFHQTFLHLHSFETSSQYVSQLQLSLVGLISPRVGISISFNNNYDSQMPDAFIKKSTSTLTSGLQFKF